MSQQFIDCGDGTYKMRTCAWSPPGDHPVGCGMYLKVKDGRIVGVEGDPEHPISQGRLCTRCLSLPEYVYSDKRVTTPLRRAREDRGFDKWEPITWDEAMDLIEENVRRIQKDYGNEAVAVFQGTGRAATLYAPATAYAALQTPNAGSTLAGESCYGPRCGVANFILGAGYPELDYAAFFPDRYDDSRYVVPEYIVLWGKDPLFSNPDGFFGHALIDLMKRGSKFITVDPRLTWIGARAAYHLQLRPGTDAALGLGLLNIIIQEDLYDHDFVEKWCFGFDDLAARAAEYPVERVAEITWVQSEAILAAARTIATAKPVSFMWGLAIDACTNGVQAGHCFLALAAITGNLDVPGGVTLAAPASFMGKWRYDCSLQVPPDIWSKQIINPDHKAYVTRQHSHPDSMLDAMETGEPYGFKMAWFIGTNPLPNMAVQPRRWQAAFEKLEFNVVSDVVMTPTAMAFCDVFLPVSTFAEQNGIVLPHFGRNTHFLGAMNKTIEMGCKSDLEIAMMIGKRLNPSAWPWETVEEFFTDQIKDSLGITFDELSDVSTVQTPFEYRKYEKGLLRNDGYPGFNTPTGCVELKQHLSRLGRRRPAVLHRASVQPLQQARAQGRLPARAHHGRPPDDVLPFGRPTRAVAAPHHSRAFDVHQPGRCAEVRHRGRQLGVHRKPVRAGCPEGEDHQRSARRRRPCRARLVVPRRGGRGSPPVRHVQGQHQQPHSAPCGGQDGVGRSLQEHDLPHPPRERHGGLGSHLSGRRVPHRS